MKIKLLIASDDKDYTDHLSKVLLKNYTDEVIVSICSSLERFNEVLNEQTYDVVLMEASFSVNPIIDNIVLPLILWSEDTNTGNSDNFVGVRKYQRISSIFTDILENYAMVSSRTPGFGSKKANITAVWSPSGGVGKTTVAMALAASGSSGAKQTMYLNLELFSSTPVYFDTSGKSISRVFEMLETSSGNVDVLIKSLHQKDAVTGISYFCCPEFFDDINILSVDNISSLLRACSGLTGELIIDMSCLCDERTRYIFDAADRIFIVSDSTAASKIKMKQFTNHHNIFSQIKEKTCFIANKGASFDKSLSTEVISLPYIQSEDAGQVYKILTVSLSKYNGVLVNE